MLILNCKNKKKKQNYNKCYNQKWVKIDGNVFIGLLQRISFNST